MRISFTKFLVIAAVAGVLVLYATRGQRQPHLGATPSSLSVDIALDPNEILVRAAAGNLAPEGDPALVFGTRLRDGGGRVHVLHRRGNRYSEVWQFSNPLGGFDSSIIIDVNNDHRDDLVTLWRGGNGAYLDVRVFEWGEGTYRELWNLYQHVKDGQLTQSAGLLIEQIDAHGNVQLVVRAPNIPQGSRAHGPVAHQVSIYRWDSKKQTLTLFRRFIDTRPSWE